MTTSDGAARAPPPEPAPAPEVSAPPAVADPDVKGARSFLRGFVTAALVLLGAVSTASVVVDPTGVLGLRIIPPSQQTLRDDKAQLFDALPEKPAIVVLGSSRTWAVRPARITELTGLPAFSFCVDNNYIYDLPAIYRFVHAHGGDKLRRLLIGVDAELFQATKGGRLEYSRFLRPYADPGVIPPLWQMMPQLLVGATTVKSDFQTLGQMATAKPGETRLFQNVSLPDGLVIWPRYEEEIKKGSYDLDAKLKWSIATFKPAYGSFTALYQPRIDVFRALLEQARKDGVAVDAFIPPLHPRGYKELIQLSARTAELRRVLTDLGNEGLLRYVPDVRLSDINGDPNAYYDFQHMKVENGDKIVARVYGAGMLLKN